MNSYSSTQGNNLLIFAGLLTFILGKFGVNIAESEIVEVIAGIISIWGLVSNWIKRYKQGDVTLGGWRK